MNLPVKNVLFQSNSLDFWEIGLSGPLEKFLRQTLGGI